MEKKGLLEKAGNPELIPGIYNYCNRWCERCQFTARCLQFQMEKEEASHSDSQSSDEDNARFWEGFAESLSLAMELIEDFAEREGIDLNASDPEACAAEQEERREAARSHPCSQLSLAYSKKVNRWFDDNADQWEAKESELQALALISVPGLDPGREAFEIGDAGEVIRWHQHFIHVKITRALEGIQRGIQEDANGSAKAAMAAIDHSMSAWANLLEHFPNEHDSILDVLTRLLQIKKVVESTFPDARIFVRPGFDEYAILTGRR